MTADRWGDLRVRLISALVMVVVGGAAIWVGGAVFVVLVAVLVALMIWELARFGVARRNPNALFLAVLAGFVVVTAMFVPRPMAWALLALPSLALWLTPRQNAGLAAGYGLAVMLAGFGLILLRLGVGFGVILWLVALVAVSDMLGYFAGRYFGGPKFWPSISPKKTWSGTVAGWVGAVLVGFAYTLAAGGAGWGFVIASPLVAFAGQIGDIAESAVKRRAGVKDASGLIPGHGGVLDRFDALIGAVLAVLVLYVLVPLVLGSPGVGTPGVGTPGVGTQGPGP